MRRWRMVGVLALCLTFGVLDSTVDAQNDITDTTWEDMSINARNWVPGVGSNGWFFDRNRTDYDLAFDADGGFTMNLSEDDSEVLSGDYEQGGFWGRVSFSLDEDQLVDLVTSEVEALADDEDEDLTIDSITIDNVYSFTWVWRFYDTLRLNLGIRVVYTLEGNDGDIDTLASMTLSGNARIDVEPFTIAGTSHELTTSTSVWAYNFDFNWQEWTFSFDELFERVAERGTMTVDLGPNDDLDLGDEDFLATEGDGTTWDGLYDESTSFFGIHFVSFDLADEDALLDAATAAMEAAVEDSDPEITIDSVTVRWSRTKAHFLNGRMGLIWFAFLDVEATVDDETTEWDGIWKIRGLGEPMSDDVR